MKWIFKNISEARPVFHFDKKIHKYGFTLSVISLPESHLFFISLGPGVTLHIHFHYFQLSKKVTNTNTNTNNLLVRLKHICNDFLCVTLGLHNFLNQFYYKHSAKMNFLRRVYLCTGGRQLRHLRRIRYNSRQIRATSSAAVWHACLPTYTILRRS